MKQFLYGKKKYPEQHIGKKAKIFFSCVMFLAVMFFVTPVTAAVAEKQPAPLPDPDIPGFHFPESELTLNQWVFSGSKQEIYKHAWGIWTALTMESGEKLGEQPLLVFETWKTPNEMKDEIDGKSIDTTKRRLKLQRPHQLKSSGKDATQVLPSILVAVAYNPTAEVHAVSNKLFWASTLKKLIKYGYKDIPNFPVTAITIKPVYKIIAKENLTEGRYYKLNTWPGPPPIPQWFDESTWDSYVYVDIKNEGKGDGSIDRTNMPRTPQTTYNLTDFIYYKITEKDLEYLNEETAAKEEKGNLQVGDYVILVAMHVGTREMKRWTWQTFWWSANPDEPFKPSSKQIAGDRPSQLKGARRHYAMAAAYQMVEPAQPLYGGINQGTSLYAYNPYLEAGFSLLKRTPDFQQVRAVYDPGNNTWEYNLYGVQSNCMTCHNLALYDPNVNYIADKGSNESRPYSAGCYISLDDTIFQNVLKLDFLWSIIGNLVLDK